MGKCILTGVDITDAVKNDSKGHIIASALGGRLKPRGILSINGNNVLDRKVDNPHIKAMQVYMAFLDGSRDRGGKAGAVIQMKDKDGKRYIVAGDKIRPLDHEYNVKIVDGKIAGTIKATTIKQAKELIGRVKKDFNLTDAEAEELLKKAERIEDNPGLLGSEILAGPVVEFPSAFTMAAMFCAYNGLPMHPGFVNYVESLDENAFPRPMPPDTFYFINQEAWFELKAEMGHCLILYGDPKRKQALFFSQLFKMLGIAVLIPYTGNEPICYTYGVDVLEGRDVSVDVNTARLSEMDWKETHKLGDAELYAINQERGRALMQIASNRRFNRESQAIWDKHMAGKDINGRMTKAERTALYKDLRNLLNRMIKPEHLDQSLLGLKQQFDRLGGIDE